MVPIAALLVIGIAAGGLAGDESSEHAGNLTTAPIATTPIPTATPTPPHEPAMTIVEEYDPPVAVYFRPAEHVGYRFDDGGAVFHETTFNLGHDSSALADAEVIDGEGTRYFRMVSGVFDGYLVPASEVVTLRGQ